MSQQLLKNYPEESNNLYYSFDLGLVSYLLCLNFELVDLDRSMGKKVRFILRQKKNIDNEVKKYWDCKTSIDAQTYFNQIKRLKNQIYSQF